MERHGMPADGPDTPRICVAIVTFRSAGIIAECLESLFASSNVRLSVAVCDNASDDGTIEAIAGWADAPGPLLWQPGCPIGHPAMAGRPMQQLAGNCWQHGGNRLTVIASPVNQGYARAVNAAIDRLRTDHPDAELFWILNPDCIVPPSTAANIAAAAAANPGFGLIGGRVIYYDDADHIQTDGGRVSRLTAACESVNRGRLVADTPFPDPATLDYVTGASMVVSRAFLDRAGPMPEEYFLYYEEVAWAYQRGSLPILFVPDAIVYHHGGTTIGTGNLHRPASEFANYFNYRNRRRFAGRYYPGRTPIIVAHGLAKALQLMVKGHRREARGLLAGLFDMAPPSAVRDRVAGAAAQRLAFERHAR